ncbi:MAG: hypothetical protein IPM39_16240 [Chloroflexi bacterium]|nr:hypothetical protein [Chloroflexota bacterium]
MVSASILANKLNRHPEWINTYERVTVNPYTGAGLPDHTTFGCDNGRSPFTFGDWLVGNGRSPFPVSCWCWGNGRSSSNSALR